MRKKPLYFFGAIVIVLVLVWFYLPPLTKYQNLKQEDERLDREMKELSLEIEALEKERNLLKNDIVYLEKVIREELGLVRPGETLYKFVEEEPESELPAIGLTAQ